MASEAGFTAKELRGATVRVYGRTMKDADGNTIRDKRSGKVKYYPPFYAKLIVRTDDDQRRMMTKNFPKDEVKSHSAAESAAKDWQRLLIAEAERREAEEAAIKNPRWTVSDYAAYVAEQSPANPTTKDRYKPYLKRIQRRFGGIFLEELTADDIANWQADMALDGLAPATIVHAHALLNQVMRYALEEDGLITRNPCKKRAARPPRRTHKEPNSLGASERGRLLDYLETASFKPVRLAAYISVLTSMRLGEVCGLRWKDVDLERGIIHVRNSIGIANGGTYQKPPKTGASIRDIPMAAQLVDALKSRKADMWGELSKVTGNSTDVINMNDLESMRELFVIGNVAGDYANPAVISKQWSVVADTLELKGTQGRKPTFHDLRHTFITAAVTDANADIKTVASMAGHSKVSHTLDIYASADPDAKARLAATIDEITRAEKEAAKERRIAEEKRKADEAKRRGEVIQLATGTEGGR